LWPRSDGSPTYFADAKYAGYPYYDIVSMMRGLPGTIIKPLIGFTDSLRESSQCGEVCCSI
jgi:hypothetical protein